MPAFINLEGQTIGKWTVLEREPNRRTDTRHGSGYVSWRCRCTCGNVKSVLAVTLQAKRTGGCAECYKQARKTYTGHKGQPINRLYRLFVGARQRAKRNGLEFSIDWRDFTVPESCPLLGIPLSFGNKSFHPNNPSLDRIDSTKGYIPGNVWIISWRANMIKGDASIEELEMLSINLRSKIFTKSN